MIRFTTQYDNDNTKHIEKEVIANPPGLRRRSVASDSETTRLLSIKAWLERFPVDQHKNVLQ